MSRIGAARKRTRPALARTVLVALAFAGCGAPAPRSVRHAALPAITVAARQAPDGTHVTLAPLAIELTIPSAVAKAVYSGDQLAALRGNCEGEWDPEYVRVLDRAIPFAELVLQTGEQKFCEPALFGDLHVRVYVTDRLVETTRTVIAQGANSVANELDAELAAATKRNPPDVFGVDWDVAPPPRTQAVDAADQPGWRSVAVSYKRWYGQYGGVGHVDFYLKPFGDMTVVVAFMYMGHAVVGDDEDPVRTILASMQLVPTLR